MTPSASFSEVTIADPPLIVYEVRPITNERILPDAGSPARREGISETHISIKACPGEYEPFSLVVYAHENLVNLILRAGDMVNQETGAVIPASEVDLRLVKCWYQGCPNSMHYKYCPGYQSGLKKVLVPELLIKDDNLIRVDLVKKETRLRVTIDGREEYILISESKRHDLKRSQDQTIPVGAEIRDAKNLLPLNLRAGMSQQFWGTVRVPDGVTSGVYKTEILIQSQNAPVKKVNLELLVLPLNLAQSPMEYSLYYRGRIDRKKGASIGSEYKSPKQLELEMKNMVDHGVVTCTSTQSFYPNDDFRGYLYARERVGMKKIFYAIWAKVYFDRPELAKALLTDLKLRGYSDIYFYGGEELTKEEFHSRFDSWAEMKELGGKVFVASKDETIASRADLVNSPLKSPDFRRKLHEKGIRVFHYKSSQGALEEPETFRRNFGISLWQLGYDGTMQYAYQASQGSIWNDFDGYFREFVFAYPITDGLIDTIQWEGFREGVDDVRYLATLLKLSDQAKQMGLVTKDMDAWAKNLDTSQDLYATRESIIEKILTLKRLMDTN